MNAECCELQLNAAALGRAEAAMHTFAVLSADGWSGAGVGDEGKGLGDREV